ncbi:MAG: ABC transporter ATP-binding protein [Gammaproteobacteria bacterium]|nr:ABC transporter ATP-binding protein [Gammaproteobacteria bacterium]MDP2139261.1 ABC transporter ATP-binding protein [Gammaproteobacteria bacterium]MDP2348970.1 ABC transporter ATP-binding protein [Gammaproteobacteria bacterium]
MIIETNNLCKRYGRVEVIRNLNLQVPEGSAFAMVGTNGAGKTTTMRTLVNIIQPDVGTATVLGKNSRSLTPHDFTQIGYVSENQVLPERLTVGQYFDYLRALYSNWDRALEKSLRSRMDLPPDRGLAKLSHGMRMKTVLVAGLAFRPKLLILDEPLSGMDTLTRDEVVEGLLDQADETTILISSHELAEIENFTTHIAFMDGGILYFQESIESLRSRFREVQVTLAARKDLPAHIPESWLLPEISGHSLQFIESDFQTRELLHQKLSEHFGAVQFDAEAMSLREISKVLIKKSRSIKVDAAA